MKKSFFVLALIATALVACNKNNDEPVKPKTINSKIVVMGPEKTTKAGPADENQEKWNDEDRAFLREYFAENKAADLGKDYITYNKFSVTNILKDKELSNDMNELYIKIGEGEMKKYATFNGNLRNREVSANVQGQAGVPAHFYYKNTNGKGQEPMDDYIILDVPGYGLCIGFNCWYLNKKTNQWSSNETYNDWILSVAELKDDDPIDDPTKPAYVDGEVEFDVHQQIHQDWKEIKTSIHVRATVDATILIPIPQQYQAQADDVVVRTGEAYTYMAEDIQKEIEIDGKVYPLNFEVAHTPEGIRITVYTSDADDAIQAALAKYEDGLTFEVHTYAIAEEMDPSFTNELLWGYVRTTKCLKTTVNGVFGENQATHVFGQITSAFFPEDIIKYDEDGKK